MDAEPIDECQRLCQLFRGRFNTETAQMVIADCGGLEEAVRFLMLGSTADIQDKLNQSEDFVRSFHNDSANILPYLEDCVEDLQFSCLLCNRMWWKRVPIRKPVAKCYKCRRKYDPVPKEHQWGWGEFICPNKHTFRGFGIMNRTKSKCYKCNLRTEAELLYIIPPKKRDDNTERPKINRHNCNGINCYRKTAYQQYSSSIDATKPPICIHPKSPATDRQTRIHCASREHISTGSTVATFLDQGSLDGRAKSPARSLETIFE